MARISTKRSTPRSKAQLDQPDLGPVEQVPIDLLKPYAGNARTHSEKQLATIVRSLESFGWMNPLIAERDGTIIAGHGRWMAAKQLGLAQCPVIRVEHLTPDAARAYRLADNRIAELSDWDRDTLEIELQHLSSVDLDFNIETIGWDMVELDLLLDPEKDAEAGDPADEDVPAPEAVAVTREGELWLLNDHRLYCGSSLEALSFAILMDGQRASVCFQDAPYNVPISGHVSGLGKTKHREFAMASGEMDDAQFRSFLATNAKLVAEHVVDGAILAMCMDWRGDLLLQLAIKDAGLSLINLAIWAKTNAGMGSLYRSQHEFVLITKKGSAPHINNVELGKHGRYRTNVWRYAGVNSFGKKRMEQLGGHPTPKPISLVADYLRDVSHRGQIVIDSFMGSGTTLLAAERTGRIAYGMDLDPVYIDLTVRRWQKMTGGVATLAATGQTFAQVEAERLSAHKQ
jgi:DNA modification methylase